MDFFIYNQMNSANSTNTTGVQASNANSSHRIIYAVKLERQNATLSDNEDEKNLADSALYFDGFSIVGSCEQVPS